MSTSAQRVRLRQRARSQHGIVTLAQAREAGLGAEAVRHRVRSGQWRRAGARVFQVAEHEETPESRTVAAVLSLGEDATLIGRSAAWWWRLHDTAPARVEVAVDRPGQPRDREGVVILHRTIEPVDRTRRHGLRVLKQAPAVLDASVRLGLSDGARLMDRALQRERVTLEALREVHARAGARRGAVLARRLLVLAGDGARSEAERVAHRLMAADGITGWRPNAEIVLPGFGRALGDVVFDAQKVVLEIDGWAYHRDLRAFLRDGPRQSALAAAGFVVLRTHWYELHEEPERFLRTLRRTLAARS